MTAATPLAFPGGPTFAGWNRQFLSLQPRSLVACHLPIHCIEALVRLRRESHADAPTRLLLDEIPDSGGISIERLEERVPISSRVLHEFLLELTRAGLIETHEGQNIACTLLGRQMRAMGAGSTFIDERRSFHFLDLRPASMPRFVVPDGWPLRPWPAGLARPGILGIAAISESIRNSAEWKRECGFPEEVVSVLDQSQLDRDDAWRGVAIVRVERLSAAMVRVGNDRQSEWLVFPATSEGWSIGQVVIFRLPGDAIANPPEEMWRMAWHHWCMSRRFAAPEVLASRFEVVDNEVRLEFSETSGETIRKIRDEITKSESWLTIDVPPFRWAARIVLARI